jgi:hypothetical protein
VVPSTLPTCLDALERSLRDPLRSIEGVGGAIASARSPDQQRHLLRAVNQAGLMIERAAEAAIDLLRCQHAAFEPDLSVFTLRSLLHEVRIAAHGAHIRARPTIELLFPDHEAVIRGDRRRLVRITSRLLDAVPAANEEGGAITLGAVLSRRGKDLVDVEIRVGLPCNSNEPQAIADNFTRPPLLGPSSSTEDLQSHSASVVAQRLGLAFGSVEVPRAVLVRFTCPLVAMRPTPPTDTPVQAALRAPVLLFDTPTHRLRALEAALSESGYQPLTAHHRDDALAILFQQSAVAVLVATDGVSDAPLQFARHLRATVRTSGFPIVLVARHLNAPQLAFARRCVDSVLISPVNASDAVRHLNGCLHQDRRGRRRPLELY